MQTDDLSRGPAAEVAGGIKGGGPITFAEFMDIVLYGEGGYYTSGKGSWGAHGDYITSLDVSPVFARLLARQVSQIWDALGRPAEFGLMEAGAGRGWLTRGIVDTIRSENPGLSRALRATLVEKGPGPPQPQDDDGGEGQGLAWCGDISEAGVHAAGCVLSNELIDSFPVHRVLMEEGGLKELYVGLEGSSFVDVPGPLSTPELAGYFESAGVTLVHGQKAEVNLEAGRWLRSAAARFTCGFVITIDYGLPARELYAPERREGTLHCHYRHTLNDNPYINIGSQDITTQVDFSALVTSGRASGLELTGFATQKNFLLGLGICDELSEADGGALAEAERIAYNRELARLIAPGGMGDTFKVLIQHKGVERPLLSGFSFKDQSRFLP
ncbi:MAG: class I SAM-dependent methyltransferase [Thermodesulfobacteriota bacterium]